MSGKRKAALIIVQVVTVSRSLSAILFISLALIPRFVRLATFLYLYAIMSDLLDGFLARKFQVKSAGGEAMDLFSDKYLTLISTLYAAARGLPLVACAMIVLREIFLISMRSILVDSEPLIPPNRLIGALIVAPIWTTTLILLNPSLFNISMHYLVTAYWFLGAIAILNLSCRIWRNRTRIAKTFFS